MTLRLTRSSKSSSKHLHPIFYFEIFSINFSLEFSARPRKTSGLVSPRTPTSNHPSLNGYAITIKSSAAISTIRDSSYSRLCLFMIPRVASPPSRQSTTPTLRTIPSKSHATVHPESMIIEVFTVLAHVTLANISKFARVRDFAGIYDGWQLSFGFQDICSREICAFHTIGREMSVACEKGFMHSLQNGCCVMKALSRRILGFASGFVGRALTVYVEQDQLRRKLREDKRNWQARQVGSCCTCAPNNHLRGADFEGGGPPYEAGSCPRLCKFVEWAMVRQGSIEVIHRWYYPQRDMVTQDAPC